MLFLYTFFTVIQLPFHCYGFVGLCQHRPLANWFLCPLFFLNCTPGSPPTHWLPWVLECAFMSFPLCLPPSTTFLSYCGLSLDLTVTIAFHLIPKSSIFSPLLPCGSIQCLPKANSVSQNSGERCQFTRRFSEETECSHHLLHSTTCQTPQEPHLFTSRVSPSYQWPLPLRPPHSRPHWLSFPIYQFPLPLVYIVSFSGHSSLASHFSNHLCSYSQHNSTKASPYASFAVENSGEAQMPRVCPQHTYTSCYKLLSLQWCWIYIAGQPARLASEHHSTHLGTWVKFSDIAHQTHSHSKATSNLPTFYLSSHISHCSATAKLIRP